MCIYTYECSLNGYIRILAINGIYRCIYIYICVSNKLVPTVVGVDVLDLTHINLRKVGFDYCDCESLELLPSWSA